MLKINKNNSHIKLPLLWLEGPSFVALEDEHFATMKEKEVEFLFGIERKVFPIVFVTHHSSTEFSSLPSMHFTFILGWALLARLPPPPFFPRSIVSPRSRSKEVGSAPLLSILGRNHVSSIKYHGFFSWPPSASVHTLVSYWAPCFLSLSFFLYPWIKYK